MQQNARKYLAEAVTPLLTPMLEELAINQPRDPASFMAKKLMSSSDEVLKLQTARELAPGEVEMDTAEAENLTDEQLQKLILPNGKLPGFGDASDGISEFSVSYSNALLHGWVKQRSPGCAAASVAGAFNALRGLSRDEDGALSMDDVIEVLKEIQEERVAAKKGRVERLLCGASLDPLVAAVEEKLLEEGKFIGGSRRLHALAKKLISSTIKVILAEKAGERLGGENSENLNSEAIVMGKTGDDADVFDRINELILEKQQRAKEDDQGEEATVEDGSDGDGEEDDAVRKKSADFSWKKEVAEFFLAYPG